MIQSPNDKKNYRTVTLNNGLRVLLIENIDSTKSAAALAVNAGHFSDPKERQGLAHFLEHMLFLGTEKYPDGSEYQQFISQYNGSNNAWTATEHTCFFFDIHHDYFSQALDRFSDFFISPLLSEEFINKERQNIDAEFKLKLKDDIRRLYDVHKETINPLHPFAQFSVGNIDTLEDRDGISIRQEIVNFFQRYYCAEFMTVVLEGPQSLDELNNLAIEYFSKIKQARHQLDVFDQPLYLTEHQKVFIEVCPVNNDRQLIISFAMPSIDHLYRNKPESILAYLLGHEGPGSILSYLKHQQWAFRLTAGSGINGSNFKDFNISIALTDAGEEHIDDIVDIVFSYIYLLKQSPIAEYFFQEKKSIAMLSFNYQEKLKPLDSVSQYAVNMHHYPPEHYIFGDYMMEHFDHKSITELLAYMNTDNMRLINISQSTQNTYSNTSKWYQVPYNVTPITAEKLARWQNSAIDNALYLPPKNNYIVENPVIQQVENEQLLPEIISQADGFTCWFKQDHDFKVPKGYIYLGIDCPNAIKNASTIAMTRLFIELYSDNIIEENYDAELAGIHYHLYAHQGGMTLQLSGVSEKQPILLSKLLTSLKNQTFNVKKFTLIKNQLISFWHNADKSKSISQLFSTLSSTMQPKKPSSEALSNALTKITLEDFVTFTHSLFQKVYLELLIHGNWRKNDALQISANIQTAFESAYHNDNMVQISVIDSVGHGEKILPLLLPEHDHASVIYYPMPNKDIDTIAITMILSQLFSPHFFQEMRTEKQYGYLVGVGYVPIGNYPGIAFYVQSPHTNAFELTQAIDSFTEKSVNIINKIQETEWQQLQYGLAGQLQENDASLRITSQRYWGAICNKDHLFNRKSTLINAVKNLQLNDIITFINQYLSFPQQQDKVVLVSIKDKTEKSLFPKAQLSSPKKLQKNAKLKI